MSVIDINGFQPKRGYQCFNACIVNCLSLKGFSVSSSDIMFSAVSGGLFECRDNLLYCKDFSGFFIQKYGINIEADQVKRKEAFEILQRNVHMENDFLIVSVRPDLLDYSVVFSENSQGYTHGINVLKVNEKEVFFVDGYVFHVGDEVCFGHRDVEKFLDAWGVNDEYGYCLVNVPNDLNEQKIKNDAQKNFRRYIQQTHEVLINLNEEQVEEDIMYMFRCLKEKMSIEKCMNSDYINHFLTQAKVEGFLIVKNMIWEKMNELAPRYGEEYDLFIKRWNHFFMIIRKNTIRNNYEKTIALIDDIYKLIYEEDAWLTDVLTKEGNNER